MDLIALLEKEIEKLGKDLNINEKYIKSILECNYRSISLTKNTKKGEIVILLKLPITDNGKQNNRIIKTAKESKQDIVIKMDKFVHLTRVHRALKKAEKAKEDYIVKTLSVKK